LPHQEEEGLPGAGLVLVQSRENLRDHFAIVHHGVLIPLVGGILEIGSIT